MSDEENKALAAYIALDGSTVPQHASPPRYGPLGASLFAHEGDLRWKCVSCSKTGECRFTVRTGSDIMEPDDFLPVLIGAEIEHSLGGCLGSLYLVGHNRTTRRVSGG